jgi:membrane-bound inhibitor of C-type lysozyme
MRFVLLPVSLGLLLPACTPSGPEAGPAQAQAAASEHVVERTSTEDSAARPPAPLPVVPPTLITYHYQCGDYAVRATFGSGEAATVSIDGRRLSLPQVPSASGSRYADGAGNEIRTDGDTEAWLTLAGEGLVACMGQPVENATVAATAPEYPLAREACLDTVAQETNSDRAALVISGVARADSSVAVTILVPGAAAPWSCLAGEDGTVEGAVSMGPDGAP